MAKRFKSKRKLRHNIIVKYIFLIILCYLIIKLCLFLTFKIPILKFVFKHNKLEEYKNYIVDSTINNPQYMLPYFEENNIKSNSNDIQAFYIKNEIKKPTVYIYNTHQKEAYSNGMTVLDAAYVMEEKLKNNNIDVIVEKRDITEFMRTNNISYSYSYYASKFYVQDALEKNNLDLLIDLHRDATNKEASTIQINGVNYAKILFVIGGENENYKENYELTNKINNIINNKYKDLSRGIIIKTGKNVNGIYNQNLSNKIILLELGCNNSTFEEVQNTINLISPLIGEYLYETR